MISKRQSKQRRMHSNGLAGSFPARRNTSCTLNGAPGKSAHLFERGIQAYTMFRTQSDAVGDGSCPPLSRQMSKTPTGKSEERLSSSDACSSIAWHACRVVVNPPCNCFTSKYELETHVWLLFAAAYVKGLWQVLLCYYIYHLMISYIQATHFLPIPFLLHWWLPPVPVLFFSSNNFLLSCLYTNVPCEL